MRSTQLFVCHANENKADAIKIALSLRSRGFKVFLDENDCPPGQSYDERIQKAVNKSSVFIFLISPQSVQEGRYTLTELHFASQKWPNPHKSVLPVMVARTEFNALPDYLKAVTVLQPHGNLAAEVSAAVASLTNSGPRIMLAAGAAALVIFVIGVLIYVNQPRPYTPPYNPTTSYTPPVPNFSAVARCSKTGVIGKGTGSTRAEASEDAIQDCIAEGGIEGCCTVVRVD